MPFDHAFQPVASKGLVFWGSSAECQVYAADAKSGAERWSFYTDGPVRFAPAIWNDRLFVGSDDGYLYCLAIQDGTLLWKKRGGPNSEMVIGNDRLVSRWPARGGPVIHDGIVYFAAGIWTAEGTYLYAIDASTGEVLWVNDSSGGLFIDQPHNGNRANSGVSIQGYLTIAGDSLIAPTGRATPAVFDRKSGEFKDFHLMRYSGGMGKRKGAGPFTSAIDDHYFIAEDAFFLSASGNYEGRGLPVTSTAVSPDLLVFSIGKQINAIRRSSFPGESHRNTRLGKTIGKIEWSISCSDPVGVSVSRAPVSNYAENFPEVTQTANPPLIVAGTTIIAGTLNNKIVTADITSTQVVTTAELDGLPMGLAVAEHALYVCTDKGTIYCFVEAQSKEPGSLNLPKGLKQARDANPYSDTRLYDQVAEEIIKSAELDQGYCVDLGCGDGALSYALAKASKLQIIAVDDDPKRIATAREKLSAAGLYGTRVTLIQRDLTNTGLPSRFANLVVSGRTVTEGADALASGAPGVVPSPDYTGVKLGNANAAEARRAPSLKKAEALESGGPPPVFRMKFQVSEEAQRLLHPYGGIALAGKPGSMQRIIGKPPAGAGDWTHQYADAANTLCSSDSLAKGPLKMQWFQDFGIQVPSRHGRAPAPLYKDGIMIVEGVHGLTGVDAYNGNRLWHYPLHNILKAYDQEHLMGTAGTGSNMCLADDSVFVRKGNHCLRINMQTGKLMQTYTMPDEKGVWGFIACDGGILYGTSSDKTYVIRQLYGAVSDMKELLTQSNDLFALDVETGETKWVYRAESSIRHNAIAIGDGNVCIIDKPKAAADLADKPKELADTGEDNKPIEAASTNEPDKQHLICLDSDTGKVLWEQSADIYGTTLALSTMHNGLLMSYQYSQRRFQLPSEKGDRLTGFSTTDGKRLWDIEGSYISRPIINDLTIYAQPYAYDLLSGEQIPGFQIRGRGKGGCGPISGSRNLLLYRSGTLGYTDLLNNTGTQNYGPARPGCWINAIVGGGLVLMPDATDRCVCSYQIKASIGLVPQTQERSP